jgi:GTPase Era involved in 16S rRNA processing
MVHLAMTRLLLQSRSPVRPGFAVTLLLDARHAQSAPLQVVIYDLPGMHGSRDFRTRSQAMRVAATWLHVQECDVYALIVDCAKQLSELRTNAVDELARVLGSDAGPQGFEGSWQHKPVILLLNKIDLLSTGQRREVRAAMQRVFTW